MAVWKKNGERLWSGPGMDEGHEQQPSCCAIVPEVSAGYSNQTSKTHRQRAIPHLIAHGQQRSQDQPKREALVMAHKVAHVFQHKVLGAVKVGVAQKAHHLRGWWWWNAQWPATHKTISFIHKEIQYSKNTQQQKYSTIYTNKKTTKIHNNKSTSKVNTQVVSFASVIKSTPKLWSTPAHH